VVGIVTAFLTSFYMFRLWFLTFFGEYRGHADGIADEHGHPAHGADRTHGHAGIHESPPVMLGPLIILAILSLVGGYVGVPGSLGGGNRFEKFLDPVFRSTTPALNTQHKAPGKTTPPEQQTEGTEPQTSHATELVFTGISVAAALLGFGLAWTLYYRNPQFPERVATDLDGLYDAVVHKYYIDELYGEVFVKPLVEGSTRILWQGVDQSFIDGTVNNSADAARHVSDEARHMQSGNLRSYAGWIAAGSAVIIAFMIWMGVGQ
jgi:NADH-quinone oxidoreductase subunit L